LRTLIEMPYKNKAYKPQKGCYYHIYGKGLNDAQIYSDHDDYALFLYLLKKYLTPDYMEERSVNGRRMKLPVNSVAYEVNLFCYCLMPTHFHLLVENLENAGISNLMKRVVTLYSSFFNSKYGRQGTLLQGGYRAVLLSNENQFVYVSRYIHLNPIKANLSKKAINYRYSSYVNYLEKKCLPWLILNPRLLEATDYADIETYLVDIEDNPKEGIL